MGEAYEPRSGCPINAAHRICHAAQQKSSSVTGSTVRPPDTVELIAAREINQNPGTLRLRSPRSGHEQRQPSTLSETLSYPAPPVRTKSAGWGSDRRDFPAQPPQRLSSSGGPSRGWVTTWVTTACN